ncbi:Deoxycytidine monophosphate (dCMP) deaminase [Marasmius sp. AFHP31]|nr:Deoxycytidine monophosphate (dCMP) deaminase [Marasmius sp. AFHP31]
MLVAIVGTRSSGKTTVKDYLVSTKGFTPIHVQSSVIPNGSIAHNRIFSTDPLDKRLFKRDRSTDTAAKHRSFLSMDMTPLPSPAPFSMLKDAEDIPTSSKSTTTLQFFSPESVLDHVTRHWRTDFVTTDLNTRDLVEIFLKRPFFMLLCVDAPLLERFLRSDGPETLEEFVREDDALRFGKRVSSISEMKDLVNIWITNDFGTESDLFQHLESLDLSNPSLLRPDWDTYFMTLASLASHRSNCMKRRVGAILVRDKRIVSTGYNGVQSVVYNLTYKMDDASARLFQEAGVELRRFDPNIKSQLPILDGRLH